MWSKLFQLFRRKTASDDAFKADAAALQELQAVKKLLRKQNIFLEKMREELLAQSEGQSRQQLQPLLSFAEAYFFLSQSLGQYEALSAQRREAVEMVWSRLDGLLAAVQVTMIRQEGVPFDGRLHEAIENTSPEYDQLKVLRVLQPGYLHEGKVIKTAKVVIGQNETIEALLRGVNH
ncbi:nucleotide exchange factor GrpE [Desulforhabdus amnigena]|jgi:molecular chaperone GrpE (heat shock protein)|uniref:Nucleotide exchange factor GrpE n=1 Tax=Desulforhabdus amnigena TaxID=40218 RepID=A0A9W6D5R4_9BACT|nr:nucleotide exchange factor GrpE [Desulforhabdus amnigena]NLJ29636.1 nucleotide exchange factor GrpE [Deltaproteobacteria bacterium]GLI33851.1 hypothetical protein DAMNIGENAA_12840 [Desulforhabdus amnigena]